VLTSGITCGKLYLDKETFTCPPRSGWRVSVFELAIPENGR
jgi:hypothetical protein